MTSPDFRLGPIGQIMVPVRDAARAADFYRDVLGLPFLFAYPHMAFFDAAGVRLYLAEPESPDFRGRATLYFRVDDIDRAVAELERRGATFNERPHVIFRNESYELWMAFTKDPDDNNIGLMAERPLPSAAAA